ncbi:hypothetical protein VTH06DRAFT_4190 [Thermothelomyces fergusii]
MATLWLLSVFAVGFVAAETDDLTDFSNNLATDVGPLLVLFGDSMTKQYLSESTSFLDYFIFAMGPIGIITAVISTIRLCGHSSLRAFIGRSQEGDGVIEAELCTSTSRDVCELFTRGGITRVLGRPSILELVYHPRLRRDDDTAGLFLFRHYLETRVSAESRASQESGVAPAGPCEWREVQRWRWPWHRRGPRTAERPRTAPSFAPYPNLSLNVGIVKRPRWVFLAVAAVGFVLQAGVLVMAGTGVWILGWNLQQAGSASRLYAPVMYIVGTILMCGGMWSCAALIGQSTHELYFERISRSRVPETRLLWLQPGPQVIGDQSFDPFAYVEKTDDPVRIWTSSRKDIEPRFESYTYAAVLAVVVGYIMQFIGLRGMNAWVSLAQLAITVVMSLLRGFLRMQRMSRKGNKLADKPDTVAGHELDWLAFSIHWPDEDGRAAFWHITGRYEDAVEEGQGPDDKTSSTDRSSHSSSLDSSMRNGAATRAKTVEPATSVVSEDDVSSLAGEPGSPVTCEDLFRIRVRLAHLTGHVSFATLDDREYQRWKDEFVKVRAKAMKVSDAICRAAEALGRSWKPLSRRDMVLRIRAAASFGPGPGTGTGAARLSEQLVCVPLKPPSQATQAGWTIDSARLEAILGLCLWSLVFNERHTDFDDSSGGEKPKAETIRTLRIISAGLGEAADKQLEMDLWLGSNAIKLSETTLAVERRRSYGIGDLWLPDGTPQDGRWALSGHVRPCLPAARYLRFCGWNPVYESLAGSADADGSAQQPDEVAKLVVVQACPANESRLDLCARELFASLAMSLTGALPVGDATFAEDDGSIRLDNPTVTVLSKAFTEAGLGSHSDALLCVVPALGGRLRTPSEGQMLSALTDKASSYRRQSEWERAETLLRWACQRYLPTYEEALRTLGELYRWSLAQCFVNDDERYDFGCAGIDWMCDTYYDAYRDVGNIGGILDDYRAVKERVSRVRTENSQLPQAAEIRRQLAEAIEKGDRKETLYLLCFVTAADFQSAELKPALPIAASNDWSEVARSMLEMKADPNNKDGEGRTALSYCAELGYDIKLYADHGAYLDLPDKQHRTPLSWAAAEGHEATVKELLERGADIEAKDNAGNTPLMRASACGRMAMVKLLQERGACIDAANNSGDTALTQAIRAGREDLIRELLALGADVNGRVSGGKTPLTYAAAVANNSIIDLLLENGAAVEARDPPLVTAAARGHTDLVRKLLERGANIDVRDHNGHTPLFVAITRGCEAVAELLVEKGADIEAKADTEEMTPLIHATWRGRERIIKLLLENGANPDARDTSGFTALHCAAYMGNASTVDALLEGGADIEAVDNSGRTPIVVAAQERASEAVERLLERGAKPKHLDDK